MLAVLPRAADAHACELFAAEDGAVGAWLASPSPATPPSSSSPPTAGSSARDPLWKDQRLVVAPSGTLHGAVALEEADRRRTPARLGGILRVGKHGLETTLLLRVDGKAGLTIDGVGVWSQTSVARAGAAWSVIPLLLNKGDHRLELELGSLSSSSTLSLRVVSTATLTGSHDVAWVLPGLDDGACHGLATELIEATARWRDSLSGPIPELEVWARAGYPADAKTSVSLRALDGSRVVLPETALGTISLDHTGKRWSLEQPLAEWIRTGQQRDTILTLHVLLGQRTVRVRLPTSGAAHRALVDPANKLGAGNSESVSTLDPATLVVARNTLAMMRQRVLQALGRGDWPVLHQEIRRLHATAHAVEAGGVPWQSPGIHELALSSSGIDAPHRVLVHVPGSFAPGATESYPLVVALHGYGGSPEGILSAFLDTTSDGPSARVDGFVLAPDAFGNTFYRGAGERAVMDAIDWVLGSFPIDPNAVSITGVSMGGTGAAHIGLRHADRFAAIASICGYHSYFVRRDTKGRAKAEWEHARMRHWSPASWAENGAGLGLYLARGTRDTPLAHSRVLQQGYLRAGLRVRAEWPEAGHRVWPIVYRGARLWPWLTSFRRASAPERVVLTTDTLRYGRRAWVEITGLEHRGGIARVAAERRSSSEILVETRGVTELALSPPSPTPTTTVCIDGDCLTPAVPSRIALTRTAAGWQLGARARAGVRKRRGLEGPIRDAYLDRLVFAYGSRDPRTREANREVALAWARGGPGVHFDYPVVADKDVSPDALARSSLFLVGTPRDHLLLEQWSAQLPIRVEGKRLRIGADVVDFPELGGLFVYPSPVSDRYVVVLTAPSVGGLWRSLSLPRLLPDFIVWDERLVAATGEQLLGDAPVVTAGVFLDDWTLPP